MIGRLWKRISGSAGDTDRYTNRTEAVSHPQERAYVAGTDSRAQADLTPRAKQTRRQAAPAKAKYPSKGSDTLARTQEKRERETSGRRGATEQEASHAHWSG